MINNSWRKNKRNGRSFRIRKKISWSFNENLIKHLLKKIKRIRNKNSKSLYI